MITRSDALEIMAAVAGAHPRTAPRWHDDTDAARATADIWADMFNRHKLTKRDLLDAVIRRAADTPLTAPEPGEIIAVARGVRRERSEREKAPSADTDTAQLDSRRQAIATCPQCDPNGWIETPDGALTKCNHRPQIAT